MDYKFDTLYARDSKGKVLQWNIEVQQNGSQTDIKISYGEYNGSKVLRWQRDIQGVNIGKSNETNSYEQAVKQAESKIKLQKKRGYMSIKDLKNLQLPYNYDNYNIVEFLDLFLPKNRTDASGDIKPMKAQQYYRSKKNWIDPTGKLWSDRKYYYLTNPYAKKEKGAIITKFPCIGQPKINGLRNTTKEVDGKIVMKSKDGKEYDVMHIKDFLNLNSDIFDLEDIDNVLDGELYIHGELLQDIGSAVNKYNLNTPRIKLILFDLAIEDFTNWERIQIIKEKIKPIIDQHLDSPIEIIRSVMIYNDAQAQAFTDNCIKKGYEGAIFRQPNGKYAFGKRPQDMTKLKRTISSEFKIVDIVPQDKDTTKGNFRCITKGGLYFDVNPMGNDDYKRELLSNSSSYIGKDLQCSFYEWTKDLKPFHIIENTIRDYE